MFDDLYLAAPERYFILVWCCEDLWKKDADTRTTIVVTKLPWPALFIQLCCLPAVRQVLAVGQDPGAGGKSLLFILLLGFIHRLETKPNREQEAENIFVAPPYAKPNVVRWLCVHFRNIIFFKLILPQ